MNFNKNMNQSKNRKKVNIIEVLLVEISHHYAAGLRWPKAEVLCGEFAGLRRWEGLRIKHEPY